MAVLQCSMGVQHCVYISSYLNWKWTLQHIEQISLLHLSACFFFVLTLIVQLMNLHMKQKLKATSKSNNTPSCLPLYKEDTIIDLSNEVLVKMWTVEKTADY